MEEEDADEASKVHDWKWLAWWGPTKQVRSRDSIFPFIDKFLVKQDVHVFIQSKLFIRKVHATSPSLGSKKIQMLYMSFGY